MNGTALGVTLTASPSESTGYSANFLMLRHEVNTPTDIVYGIVDPQGKVNYDFAETVRNRTRDAYDVARENLQCG